MDKKKRILYDADVMALPSLRSVIGIVPLPDPEKNTGTNDQRIFRTIPEKKGTVKRIIAHLEQE